MRSGGGRAVPAWVEGKPSWPVLQLTYGIIRSWPEIKSMLQAESQASHTHKLGACRPSCVHESPSCLTDMC